MRDYFGFCAAISAVGTRFFSKPSDKFVVFWDCDGVIAQNSESIAMPIAGIVLNEAMRELHPEAPQFDMTTFTTDYAGGHFTQFYKIAGEMMTPLGLTLPPYEDLDAIKIARTVSALAEGAKPAPELSGALQWLDAHGITQCVVSSSEFNRVLPCVDKVEGYDFGGPEYAGGRVYSAADTMIRIFGEPRVKPMPDICYHAAKEQGVYTNRAIASIAVEDSTSGGQAWKNAGIPFIGYVGSTHFETPEARAAQREKLLKLGAVAVYDNFTDVAAHIEKHRRLMQAPNPKRTGWGKLGARA